MLETLLCTNENASERGTGYNCSSFTCKNATLRSGSHASYPVYNYHCIRNFMHLETIAVQK